MTLAVVLGGGAPNLTLMSGALHALDARGVEFDVVSTTGAGMLIGLLYAAPKSGDRQTALAKTVDMGVSDSIYRVFPVNYKVFHKPGKAAEMYSRALQPFFAQLPTDTPLQRYWSDVIQFWAATFCPSDLNSASLGLCQPPPWLNSYVDFDKLREFPGDFFLAAYSLDMMKLKIFDKNEINAAHFNAGLAMPFIYAPYTVDGETFIEGSAVDTLNYEALVETKGLKVDTAVAFDVLGHSQIIQKPRFLLDAWVQSIMVPLTRLAQYDTQVFKASQEQKNFRARDGEGTEVLMVDFARFIAPHRWTTMTDWSYSNLKILFEIGQRAGEAFFQEHGEQLFASMEKNKAKRAAAALPGPSRESAPAGGEAVPSRARSGRSKAAAGKQAASHDSVDA